MDRARALSPAREGRATLGERPLRIKRCRSRSKVCLKSRVGFLRVCEDPAIRQDIAFANRRFYNQEAVRGDGQRIQVCQQPLTGGLKGVDHGSLVTVVLVLPSPEMVCDQSSVERDVGVTVMGLPASRPFS